MSWQAWRSRSSAVVARNDGGQLGSNNLVDAVMFLAVLLRDSPSG